MSNKSSRNSNSLRRWNHNKEREKLYNKCMEENRRLKNEIADLKLKRICPNHIKGHPCSLIEHDHLKEKYHDMKSRADIKTAIINDSRWMDGGNYYDARIGIYNWVLNQ